MTAPRAQIYLHTETSKVLPKIDAHSFSSFRYKFITEVIKEICPDLAETELD